MQAIYIPLIALALGAFFVSSAVAAESSDGFCDAATDRPLTSRSLLQRVKIQTAASLPGHGLITWPCSSTRTSRCCGDGVCDGPETITNCAEDCSGAGPSPTEAPPSPMEAPPSPTQAPPSPPVSGPAARQCTSTLTRYCCGDGVCGGPETPENCAADCSEPGPSPSGPPASGGPAPSPPSESRPVPSPPSGNRPAPSPPREACTTVPAEKPTVPTLCTSENQGCCDCGQGGKVKTYVFWTEGGATQRCFHTYHQPASDYTGDPMPVVLHMDGYSGGRKPGESKRGESNVAAEYYGFVMLTIGNLLKDGAGGFGLQFGNNNIANNDNPTPCSRSDSREIEYLEQVFAFIADSPALDAGRVYTEGFSQNGAFSLYVAVCFADRVTGAYQGGTGIVRTGWYPVAPGFQGHCSFSSFMEHGNSCCEEDFCTECQYWPLWPKTCKSKIFDCIFAYEDDSIACGGDWHAYQAMVQEGNDGRLLSFPVPDGDSSAGHRDPKNKWAWFAGCTGMVPTCSGSCAASFEACVGSATDEKSYDKFATCEGKLKAGELAGCTVGCGPTLSMLMLSEQPVVTLSQGKFGLETGLTVATGDAPKPACKAGPSPIGTAEEAGPGVRSKCYSPSSWTESAIDPKDVC